MTTVITLAIDARLLRRRLSGICLTAAAEQEDENTIYHDIDYGVSES